MTELVPASAALADRRAVAADAMTSDLVNGPTTVGAVATEETEFAGWPRCIRLTNGLIEIVATTVVGPRIIRLGFVGGPNFFSVLPDSRGLVGGDEWHSFGGHRLWHAPEVFPRTYAPDNTPVDHSWDGATLVLRNSEPTNGLAKETSVTLSPSTAQVSVVHRITNRNPWAIELAPWALSVMAPGGRAIYPQEEFRPHPDCLVPARPLVLWHFTDMSDPRWTWGRKFVQLRHDGNAASKQKVGMLNTAGWAAYLLAGEVFLKRYRFDPVATYPDMGCNTETYTDSEILEIESLGPLTRLEPGASVVHPEAWLLARTECSQDEDEIEARILPLVGRLPQV